MFFVVLRENQSDIEDIKPKIGMVGFVFSCTRLTQPDNNSKKTTIESHYRNVRGLRDRVVTQFYRKIHCLTSEFHVKFHARNRYRTNREVMSAISVFQVKFNVSFNRQAVNFS